MTETIILLHGLGRTARCWRGLERKLHRAGYATLAVDYPSRKLSIHDCARYVQETALNKAFWHSETRVHFVTHSMGSLVLESYLSQFAEIIPPEKLGRAVMLGPPWRGSEMADFWGRLRLFHRIFGPAGAEMTTAARAQAVTPLPLPLPVAVIMGRRNWMYPDAWVVFRQPNDGRVSVARSHVPGQAAHTVIPAQHGMLMNHKDTATKIRSFLETGNFE